MAMTATCREGQDGPISAGSEVDSSFTFISDKASSSSSGAEGHGHPHKLNIVVACTSLAALKLIRHAICVSRPLAAAAQLG